MENQNYFDALLYFVPAVVVLFTAFFLIRRFLDNDYRLRLLEVRRAVQKDMLPLRLQAYERMALFLERISANTLILRTHTQGMTAKDLQAAMVATIRAEFEHNLTQQVYISPQSWALIKNAKEDMVRIVNKSFAQVGEKASGIEMSKTIFDVMMQDESMPTQKALDFIKAEVKQLFM